MEIKIALDSLRKLYQSQPSQETYKFLITGDSGTGKTRLLETCPRPILVHSFDPGGTKILRKGIQEGWIIPDTRFEAENDRAPTAYDLWEAEFNRLGKEKIFDSIGTYALDSITTWSDAVMNKILKLGGKLGAKPEFEEWRKMIDFVRFCMKQITNLPCNVVVLGHLDSDKDELTGRLESSLLIPGQSSKKVPILFDEVYITRVTQGKDKSSYHLQTSSDGRYKAATRMGRDVFEQLEAPDIMALFKKANIPMSHKEY